MRRIQQVKKEFDTGSSAEGPFSTKKSASGLENALFNLRVDLNYILVSHRMIRSLSSGLMHFQRYPKLEKYIALFPSNEEATQQDDNCGGDDIMAKGSRASEISNHATDTQREQLRDMVRQKMESGEFPLEPELEAEGVLGKVHDPEANPRSKRKSALNLKPANSERSSSAQNREAVESGAHQRTAKKTKDRIGARTDSQGGARMKTAATSEPDRIEDDDFFAPASDRSESESSGED